MKFTLLSPQSTLFEGDVYSVTVPGKLGSFTVWPNHAALISSLKEGELTIRVKSAEGKDASMRSFNVDGGFVEVRDNEISVCVERVLSDKA